MKKRLSEILDRYERVVSQVDAIYESTRQQFPDCVTCKISCSDCCYALFDLSLVEAYYINEKFSSSLPEATKATILDAADRIDRDVYRLKRKAFKAVAAGEKTEDQVLFEMAAERLRCPLLNSDDQCYLYADRPITCRLYGIPTSIGGKGHTCGKSEFQEGVPYPTVNLDAVQNKLHELSADMVRLLNSSHQEMDRILMPVSMAVLTVFDDTYLGIRPDSASCTETGQEALR
ncbi:YkgJ family cysteine cluster protein [Desulfosarcina sp. OttesenSCG-928-A07]|nr:YkgJ family cysteine cluster protein [Desulfosarcina sp. OttesenSCG-928-G17]MDL2328687.1 YkgJ family cysteine cluster protein [Desulfosarcina sp. OttesenSCG-928-A07]